MSPKATPAAIKLALERGIPLVNVKATGSHGFISVSDVQRYVMPWSAVSHADVRKLYFGDMDDATLMSIDIDDPASSSSATTAQLRPPSKRAKPCLERDPGFDLTEDDLFGDDEPSPAPQRLLPEAKNEKPRMPRKHTNSSKRVHCSPPREPLVSVPAQATAGPPAAGAPLQHEHFKRKEEVPRWHLILDLDNTLVHATEDDGSATTADGVHLFELTNDSGTVTKYKLRLRDGVRDFLQKAHEMEYVIHVYTMGAHAYTGQVLGILDPGEEILGLPNAKVMCRPDGGAVFEKSIAHIIPDRDQWRRTIILDDRDEAWDKQSRDHVLKLPPFVFFGPQPSAEGSPSVLECMMSVLEYVKRGVDSGFDINVPAALKSQRQSVLKGLTIVFSGGILKSIPPPDMAEESDHPYWMSARANGANCKFRFTDETTHVVSPHAATQSVKKAREDGLHAVTPQWLIDCAALRRRLPEQQYAL
mmetsp:Transcript_4342/g.9424  ORF Transcript_4342/g.9424 Transcript_4342/m.9424 type:complete len:474 (-) Transcript_4342:108-1529(-)